jgi:hypothetical protein
MSARSKLVLAGLVAASMMGLAVGCVSANRLSLSNRLFRFTWEELDFTHEGGGSNPHVTCAVTLEGSFHSSTIRKVARALIGHVTRGIVKSESCTNGSVTILRESLPWHTTYESFRGTLPNITSVGIAIHTITIQDMTTILGMRITCLYTDRGLAAEEVPRADLAREIRTGEFTEITFNGVIRLTRVSGSTGCPPRMGFFNAGEVLLLGNTTGITVTLI